MRNNELYQNQDKIYRVLAIRGNEVLLIDCIKKTTPFWTHNSLLDEYLLITQEKLLEINNVEIMKYDDLDQNQKSEVHKKFASISSILPFIEDDVLRIRAIKSCVENFKVSESTVKNRLYLYLAYQDIGVLLCNTIKKSKELSIDEKNFRWALNKYYYNGLQLSLREAFRRLLKDKYCDDNGNLLKDRPTFRQFDYYQKKTVKKESFYISRNGKGDYMRNHRTLLGNGIRDYCPTIGYGMLDSTICDIFLVNNTGGLVGRPIMTACVDAYSGMCLGYSLGFVGGVESLRSLIKSICCNKVAVCHSFNIDINKEDWNCNKLPHKLLTDRGKEYVSETFTQLTDLGVEIINLPPYRPELKSAVEKFFDLIQGYFKKELATKGVIFEDYQERGGTDYRKKACLTLDDFEKIVMNCIIFYNTKRIIDLPLDKVGKVKPFANELWNYSLDKYSDCLIDVDEQTIYLTLLPRVKAKFRRNGLIVNSLRYRNPSFKNRYLSEDECVVAYDPDNVSKVWLFEDSKYFEFTIIEKFLEDMPLNNALQVVKNKKCIENSVESESLQGRIDLSKNIEAIAKTIFVDKVDTKNVRNNRKSEIIRGKNEQ